MTLATCNGTGFNVNDLLDSIDPHPHTEYLFLSGSPSAGPYDDHIGHTLRLVKVKGYSPVWGEGEGLELRCEDCDCLLDEFALAPDEDDDVWGVA